MCHDGLASENLFEKARDLQRGGSYDEAIETYKSYLLQPIEKAELEIQDVTAYTDALVQLMNTFQSKGEPDACVSALNSLFSRSPILQHECLRDYYSVLGYALSRTENMSEAEETMIRALTLPLYLPTPERYFRDYAYAAAVFYSNPEYQKEVVKWCQEAILQAESSDNISGKQWITAMLGSLYKRNGELSQALELFTQSRDEAQLRNDNLGLLNSLHSLVDLFLYWDIPEYANVYASQAIRIERQNPCANPMVSAQTYVNKGRALYQLGQIDSISIYVDQAQKLCASLPYNSGMVDVDLLNGICHTEVGGDSFHSGIEELQRVTQFGTPANRIKAYHQLAQTYLKYDEIRMAGVMLDSLYVLMSQRNSSNHILHIDYKPILDHYRKIRNTHKFEQYINLLIQEQQAFKKNKVNADLVKSIVDFQTQNKIHEIAIQQLKQKNQRLWLMNLLVASIIVIFVIIVLFYKQKRRYVRYMRRADEKLDELVQELNQSNIEKEIKAQEIKDFLKDKEKRQELETLTPFILKESGETKFRQCFELLYPLFLHRLREKVPAITRREELLSMLIVLKQGNKEIAELLAVAPRSVLMLRHRFRQKIGLKTDVSLENFIDATLNS